jgi:hypothetical protein
MRKLISLSCCLLLGCAMTTWKAASPQDMTDCSEVLLVTSDRAIELSDAHESMGRISGHVVHMWQLTAGDANVPTYSGDAPTDIARRAGWHEVAVAPDVFDADASNIQRIRVTHDSGFGRYVVESVVGLVFAALVLGGAAWLGSCHGSCE